MKSPFAAQYPSMPPATETLLSRSHEQLQTALNAGLIATWFWDVIQDKLLGDSNLLRIFGVSQEAGANGLPLSTFTDSIHPDDNPRVQRLIDEAMETGAIYEADYRVIAPDTEPRWVFARGRFSYDEQKKPITFSGVLVDVTDRKRAELRSQSAERRLRLAVESAKMGTWDFNPLTGELIWSDRTKELFGLSPEARVDYDLFLRGLHPDDRERTDQAVQRAFQPGESGRYDVEYRTIGLEDGQLRWIQANGQAFFNEAGVAYQFMGTVMDITLNKQAEAVLKQRVSEQTRALEYQAHQLRTVLDASLNSIIAMTAIRDGAGTIVDFTMNTANEAVIKSNFMTPDQIIGQTLLTVFPGNKDNGFFDLYVRVINTGQPEQSVQYYRDEFGLEGWFEISAVKQGEDGVVVTYNNITDRKRAELAAAQHEAELKEANAELKRSNENLQQFAQVASHDLQEPLRRIQAFSDILQNQFIDNLSDGEMDMVRRIQKSAQRMQMLIKDLLTYSQLATQPDSYGPVSLTDVLTDVLSDLEMVITEKNAVVDTAPLPSVLGSAPRLRQLFQNLIANALKFTLPDQSPVIQITAHSAQPNEFPLHFQDYAQQPFWMITVNDNGLGFEEKYKDRIFVPFQRLHNPASYGGTGIGLAICQRVAESHGGTIDVSSEPGNGSTFKVFLPVINPV
ncbi:PAS domain-containing protein [Spirosoma taeanense]|uniref:histidine kinase n=1 Tax=Spirosoma taeanense TaxID=2735870 RepID=A0A6M5Y3A7_9BACT|nr:PAS domain-containing protein [Spirosoma taeanense]QJW88215.1 PAS domain-containing protein [Spirosoma taeanense]